MSIITCHLKKLSISSFLAYFRTQSGPSWSLSYGSCIYNYLCNQCLSPPTLWVRIPLGWGILDTTLCDLVRQWLATGRCFSLGNPVSSTNKTDRHNITEILLKVTLNTITIKLTLALWLWSFRLLTTSLKPLMWVSNPKPKFNIYRHHPNAESFTCQFML